MIKLKVDEIHCENCTRRIKNALSEANIEHTVSLKEKTVTVNPKDVESVQEILETLGFDSVITND